MKRQPKQSKIRIRSVLCVLLMIGGISTFSSMSVNATTVSSEPPFYSSLIIHDSIEITSDSGLEVFPGLGTAEDPFLIEGYNITTTDNIGIYISSTTKYFIIRNCYIDASYDGIRIENVAVGTVTVINNTCNNNGNNGILLSSSVSSTVTNNTCSYNDQGINIRESGFSIFSNNTCNNNDGNGIVIYESSSSTVSNNTCINNGQYGIHLYNSGFSIVSDNTCNNSTNWYGIILEISGFSIVSNNTCNNNYRGIYLSYSTNSTVSDNTCSYNNYGIYLEDTGNSTISDNTCSYNRDDGFYGYSVSSSTVSNNTFSYNDGDGIHLVVFDGTTFTNNTCSYNSYGIWLSGSVSSIVSDNTCSYNRDDGIYGYSVSSSTVSNNTCNINSYYGINLMYSDSSVVSNNTCTNNECGIYLLYTDSFNVTLNTCNNNNLDGIYLDSHSPSCFLSYNLLQENGVYGIYLHSSPSSANNTIHHNNFVDNNLGGTSQAYDGGVSNYWYDSSIHEGNYWTDWSGAGSYSIDGVAEAFDFYPLDEPTSLLGLPIIADIIHSPSSPTELDPVSISATVHGPYGVQSVTLHYRINSGTWIEVSMTLVGGDFYIVTIGHFVVNDIVEYYITAIDNSVNHNEVMEDNDEQYFSIVVGPSDVIGPSITDIIHSPTAPTNLNTVSISATVTDASGVQSVALHYRVNSGTWQTIDMTLSGDLYRVNIGSFAVDETIEYYISALDTSISHNLEINDNSGGYYSFTILVDGDDGTFAVNFSLLPAIIFLFLVFGIVVQRRIKK